MSALNKALQKTEKEMRFCKIKYSLSKAVSTLFIKKVNARLIVPWLSNILIWAVKTLNQAIIRVEILKHWQRLEVHEISLEKYLDKRSMDLLKCKIEFSMGIILKSLPH